jgi:hypothetical protein
MSDVQHLFIKHHGRVFLGEIAVLSNDSPCNLSLETGRDLHQAFALAQHVEEITIAFPSVRHGRNIYLVLSIRGKIKRSLISTIEAGITKFNHIILDISANLIYR